MHEFKKALRIFVTGATGFIGSHLADLLLQKGYEVTALIRDKSNTRWLEGKQIKYLKKEVVDEDIFANHSDAFDYIFHIGGATFGRRYEDFFLNNTLVTENLIKSANKYLPKLKRFVMLSSLTVNGPSPSYEEPVEETASYNPLTKYAKSKAEAEKTLIKHHGEIPFTIIRAPAVYGERDTAIYGVFKAASVGVGFLIGFEDKYISLIHGIDLARGTVDAAMNPIAANEIFFISNSDFYSWDYLIGIMKEEAAKSLFFTVKVPQTIVLAVGAITQCLTYFRKKPPVFNYEKSVDFIQSYWTCSTKKAEKLLGFKYEIGIEEGIKRTFRWYKQMNWL